ncbi:glycosyl transferase [Marinobacter guineae]|uniref:Glycosyl transferase n=1 Tax=Marinobacter guineae TaxID=432303 RepID=A0A2G1VHU9_9GAMM|nr:glycosyltransferase family 4 protein [Marinobacter guineae]PHQ26363.1 glycosyl transferase [Marinobacter guineae]
MNRVLHLIDTTGPGGAETVFVQLIRELSSDFEPVVVLRGEGWLASEIRSLGIEPLILDSKGSFNARYLRELVRLIRRHRINLIHAHLLGSNVYGSLAGMLGGVPVIATFHGNVDVASQERLLGLKFLIINWGASAIVSVSRQLQKALNERSTLKSGKSHLIYNGVAQPDAACAGDDLRSLLGLPAEARLVVSVGNVRSSKGYEYLVQAVPRIKDPATHFIIIGDAKPSLTEPLINQAKALGVAERIHFMGFRKDARHLLAQADVFLLPSTQEGFSLATVEAMLAGVPVVATRSGGPEEIITSGCNGLLIACAAPDEIANAIESTRKNPGVVKMVEKAKEDAKREFSLEMMVDRYKSLYLSLMGSAGS